ncbi:MAG TPA: hypothetical protein VGO48_00555 [Conexibacter sp.]|nr:hypothetical protein [Conexibacter sp.]
MWWGTTKRILIVIAALGVLPAAGVRAEQPPGRAWELVSPSEKGGNDVIADTSRTHAAAGAAAGLPAAIAFASLGGFGDAIGGGIATEYLAQRTAQHGTSGWSTHAITPQQQPMSVTAAAGQLDPAYEAFTPELEQAVFRAWSPVTSAPNVAEVENLYAREDLRTPGTGSYRLLTSAPAPLPPIDRGSKRPFFAAATDDLAHVLFESRLALTADAPAGNPMLFKADGDALRLLAPVGGCPGGGFAAQPCSVAGLGAISLHQTADALSADGSRAVLTSAVTFGGSVSTTAPSRLFQLDDRGTPTTGDDALVQLNASELDTPEQAHAASFQGASADGERVLFTSAERLSDDAAPGGGLYLWERQPTSTTQQLSVDASAGTFTLRAQLPTANVGADTTDPLPFDASAATVQAALAPLANVGARNMSVSGGVGGPYAIAFGGALAGVAVPPLVADPSGLSGGGASATVTMTHAVHNISSIAPGGAEAFVLGAARDGRRVYFVAPGQLLAGGPPVAEDGVYLWHAEPGGGSGAISFVGALNFGDALANAAAAAVNLQARTSRVTPDGRALLFEVSDENGVGAGHDHGACGENPNDTTTGRCAELYVYRADASTPLAPAVACASCQPSGAPTDANALLSIRAGAGAAQLTAHLSHALSDDGRRVFFSSAAPLVPVDANGQVDAYEYDVPSGTVRLLSGGRDTAASYFLDASANGDDAFFVTREQLVGWDVDRAYDLYDARVGGGFPDPPVAPPACTGDACRGQAHAAPPVAGLGSATLVGPVRAAVRHVVRRRAKACRRGFERRKLHGRKRCVKKRRHRQARDRRAHRAPAAHRGARGSRAR